MSSRFVASARADVYSRVTAEIIAAVEAGTGECRMPWHHDGARIVAAIGDHVAAKAQTIDQMRHGSLVGGLPRCEHDTHRQPALVDDGVDLGAQSATRTADGVIRAPFLPPAAC